MSKQLRCCRFRLSAASRFTSWRYGSGWSQYHGYDGPRNICLRLLPRRQHINFRNIVSATMALSLQHSDINHRNGGRHSTYVSSYSGSSAVQYSSCYRMLFLLSVRGPQTTTLAFVLTMYGLQGLLIQGLPEVAFAYNNIAMTRMAMRELWTALSIYMAFRTGRSRVRASTHNCKVWSWSVRILPRIDRVRHLRR